MKSKLQRQYEAWYRNHGRFIFDNLARYNQLAALGYEYKPYTNLAMDVRKFASTIANLPFHDLYVLSTRYGDEFPKSFFSTPHMVDTPLLAIYSSVALWPAPHRVWLIPKPNIRNQPFYTDKPVDYNEYRCTNRRIEFK